MLSAVMLFIRSFLAMLLTKQPANHWYGISGPLVQGNAFFNFLTLIEDRGQTVSRRSKLSSRTTLIGEQPNPWGLLQSQDVKSQHRGAKQLRR